MSAFPTFHETTGAGGQGQANGSSLSNVAYNRNFDRNLDFRLQPGREQPPLRQGNTLLAGDGGLGGQPGGGQLGLGAAQSMGGIYPSSAGHQLDLNYLWQQVQELSGLLEQNRESTQGLVRKAGEIQTRAKEDGASSLLKEVNSELSAATDLQTTITSLRHQNNTLNSENDALSTLVGDYENALQRTLEMLRSYAHEHAQATISLHEFYTSQLASERSSSLELRGEQAEFQGRLEGLSGLVREALKWEDQDLQQQSELEALRAENSALRSVLGIPPS